MPYTDPEWKEPDIALAYKEVTVYYTWKNDEFSQGVKPYWFTTSAETMEERDDFDVRDIPDFTNDKSIIDTLKLAIDKGWLTNDGLVPFIKRE